jgi:hypothetical protein
MVGPRPQASEHGDHVLCPLCRAQRVLRRVDLALEGHRRGRVKGDASPSPVPPAPSSPEFRRISEPHRTRLLALLHELEADLAAEYTTPTGPVRPESLIDPNLVSNPVGSRHDLRRALAHLERRRLQIDPDVFMPLGGGRRARQRLRRRVERDAAARRIDLI